MGEAASVAEPTLTPGEESERPVCVCVRVCVSVCVSGAFGAGARWLSSLGGYCESSIFPRRRSSGSAVPGCRTRPVQVPSIGRALVRIVPLGATVGRGSFQRKSIRFAESSSCTPGFEGVGPVSSRDRCPFWSLDSCPCVVSRTPPTSDSFRTGPFV